MVFGRKKAPSISSAFAMAERLTDNYIAHSIKQAVEHRRGVPSRPPAYILLSEDEHSAAYKALYEWLPEIEGTDAVLYGLELIYPSCYSFPRSPWHKKYYDDKSIHHHINKLIREYAVELLRRDMPQIQFFPSGWEYPVKQSFSFYYDRRIRTCPELCGVFHLPLILYGEDHDKSYEDNKNRSDKFLAAVKRYDDTIEELIRTLRAVGYGMHGFAKASAYLDTGKEVAELFRLSSVDVVASLLEDRTETETGRN